MDDETPTIVNDAVGQGVDLHLYKNRGIISLVLVDSETQQPIGPSAEILSSDLMTALSALIGA